jgi:hypothetical protein
MRRTLFTNVAVFGLVAISALSAPTQAEVTVFLDYTEFSLRLDELAAAAGVTPYDVGEQATIRANILSDLQSMYASFDMRFTETAPVTGDYERLFFGSETGSTGLLGLAQEIDLRNLNKNNMADIYTRNFAFHVDEFSGLTNRAAQIAQLSRGLSNVAGHELGHNHGLEHCDCYARPGITPSTYANTGGLQNENVLATNMTGLDEIQREQPRMFSTLENVKLEYAEGLRSSTPDLITEQGIAHGTIATAQALTLTSLPISGVDAFFVTGGSIAAPGEFDFYSFTANAGGSFTVHAVSESLFYYPHLVDTALTLFAPDGTMLFEQNDIWFSDSAYNSGMMYGTDSLLINIPLLTTGTYTLRVRGSNNDTGQYNLVGYVASAAAAPEPTSLAFCALGLFGLVRRRGDRLVKKE